uniref:Uncharacterized protein n=1 Tax=uncultured marine virus TaxID=186617 RepID=A0A0F7L5P4_9VIRU|nr:hypothetical protein [uncultured marine virus]
MNDARPGTSSTRMVAGSRQCSHMCRRSVCMRVIVAPTGPAVLARPRWPVGHRGTPAQPIRGGWRSTRCPHCERLSLRRR